MRSRRPHWPLITAFGLLAVIVVALVVLLAGGGDDAKQVADAQTVRFQKPTDDGADPFTKPADVQGDDKVAVGSGPFGGTGSDLVCDRELLIRSLRARPDRLREWARVLGIDPTTTAVARYIRRLRPVTLTRDTRVTNHSFVDGSAVPYQAILQAGTAVLVDSFGKPVARCRCGNPLLEPIYVKTAKCYGCPPNYRPPPPCDYSEDYRSPCYRLYPHPPAVKRRGRPYPQPEPGQAATNPDASFSPSSGTVDDTYTLSVSGFRANRRLTLTLTRPDGVVERFSISTNSSGTGSKTFPKVADPVTGTYTATVTDPGSGDSATASATVSPRAEQPQQQPDQGQPPPDQGQPLPDPNYDCPDQPPAHPGEDYLRNCPSE